MILLILLDNFTQVLACAKWPSKDIRLGFLTLVHQIIFCVNLKKNNNIMQSALRYYGPNAYTYIYTDSTSPVPSGRTGYDDQIRGFPASSLVGYWVQGTRPFCCPFSSKSAKKKKKSVLTSETAPAETFPVLWWSYLLHRADGWLRVCQDDRGILLRTPGAKFSCLVLL